MNDSKIALFVDHVTNRIIDEHKESFEHFFEKVKKSSFKFGYLYIYTFGTTSRYFTFDYFLTLNKNELLCNIKYNDIYVFGVSNGTIQSFNVNQIKSITNKAVFTAVNTILNLEVENRKRGSYVYYESLNTGDLEKLPGTYPSDKNKVVKNFLMYMSKGNMKYKL